MKKFGSWLCLMLVSIAVMAVAALAFGSDAFPVPQADPSQLLISLATNWKALGLLGVLSALTLLGSAAVQAWVPDNWKFKRLITLGVAIVFSCVAALALPGAGVASVVGVLVTGFLVKGGASELYEALKGAGVIKIS